MLSDPNNAPTLERRSSIERSLDLGQLTASTVLSMYLEGQDEGNELIMLSELQVQVALGQLQMWLSQLVCLCRCCQHVRQKDC